MSREDYEFDEILGEGTFGTAYLAHLKRTGEQVVIKRPKLQVPEGDGDSGSGTVIHAYSGAVHDRDLRYIFAMRSSRVSSSGDLSDPPTPFEGAVGRVTLRPVELLRQEARLLCVLDHDRIVNFRRFVEGAAPNGSEDMLVMEYVSGGSLEAYLGRLQSRRPSVSFVSRLLLHVLQALAYIHSKDILHLDIK